MAFPFWQIKIRPTASRQQFFGVVKKVKSKIKETASNGFAIDEKMFLDQMPTSWTDQKDGDLIFQPVRFPFGTGVVDGSPDCIPKVDMSFAHVPPARTIAILETRHHHLNASVQA